MATSSTRRAQKDLLGQIKHEAEGVDEMVRNLLAITRIDAGALELRHDWIDLREIAERIVNAARRRGAKQTFEIKFPDDMPLVKADATLAEQALGNVVGNAIVHTPDSYEGGHRSRGRFRNRSSSRSPMTVRAFRRNRCRMFSINSSRPARPRRR